MNVGFPTALQQNEKLLFNVPTPRKAMLHHVTSSFNTNRFKFVLFDNFNALVSLKLTRKHTFNNMEHNYSTLKPLFNKHVLLVLLKIS